MQPYEKPPDDDRLMSLVDSALAQPQGEREEYLRQECAGDSQLFEQARDYVEWEERMGRFLMRPFCSLDLFDPTLDPGELLEGRFRILRQVGEGGMATVYEAMDEKLGKRIAIKCAKTGFRTRLTPEVRHATEIAHDNVCRIFEIHTAATDRGETDFITMEFLDGLTLAGKLLSGPLPEREARAIARQLCAGLAAAHRGHVVHGDLKSNNIILTRAADGTSRAVITDFGLARGIQPLPESGPPGGSGDAVGGAWDYMAPELRNGEKPSAASDTYALGCICYEMLSGTRLREPGVPGQQSSAYKPPRVHPRWNGILARCLDPDPTLRYPSVEEIEQALAPRSRRLMLAVAAGVGLAAMVGVGTYLKMATQPETVRLAVLPFETDDAGRPFRDRLMNEAAQRLRAVKNNRTLRLEVIPPIAAMQKKVDKREKDAKILEATHVLSGSLQRDHGRTSVRAILSDASSLQLKQWQGNFEENESHYISSALAGIVTGSLHLTPLKPAAPVSGTAAADFSAGVALARRDDRLDAALPYLERAVAADPGSPLTHARLAEALLLKYRNTPDSALLDRAKSSLKNAEKRNTDLALIWLVSGILAEYTKAYATAETNLQRARELEPRNADVWRHLGGVYESSNRLSEAEVAYQKAIELEPRYFKNYQELCSFYGDHGNYDQAIRQCRQAIALAPDMATAHWTLTRVYLLWGRYPEAERESTVTLKLDPMSPRALLALAIALCDQGQYRKAIPFFEQRARIDPENDLSYVNLGTGYRLANQLEKARTAYQKGADLARAQLSNNLNDGLVRSHLAYLYARLDDRRQAEYEAGQALQLAGGSVDAAFFVVMAYEALNDRERTLDLLSKAPPELLRRLKYDAQPDLAGLHRDTHFQKLIEAHNIQ
jgi:serine/threonine protein kinase/tetratricopeptide (TPR) repeat protein